MGSTIAKNVELQLEDGLSGSLTSFNCSFHKTLPICNMFPRKKDSVERSSQCGPHREPLARPVACVGPARIYVLLPRLALDVHCRLRDFFPRPGASVRIRYVFDDPVLQVMRRRGRNVVRLIPNAVAAK